MELQMHLYRWGWTAVTAAVVLLGVAVALLTSPAAVLVVLGVVALVALSIQRHLGSVPLREAVRAGAVAAVGGVAIVGLVGLLGPAAFGLALLLGGGCPAVLLRCLPRRRPAPTPVPRPAATDGPEAKAPVKPTRVSTASAQLADLSTEQLCWRWRTSFIALCNSPSWVARARLARDRQHYLDEMERRAPAAFRRWLDSGARAAGDPGSYLIQRTPPSQQRNAEP